MRRNKIYSCKGYTFNISYFTDETSFEKFKANSFSYLIIVTYEAKEDENMQHCMYAFDECYPELREQYQQIYLENEELYRRFNTRYQYGYKNPDPLVDEKDKNIISLTCGVTFEPKK